MLSDKLEHIVVQFMTALNSPLSLRVAIHIANGTDDDWDQLATLRVDPHCYEPKFHAGIERYRRDNAAVELLRKLEARNSKRAKENARKTALQAEVECFRTNRYLERFLDYPVCYDRFDELFSKVLSKARRWATKVCGPLPERINGHFGPGTVFEPTRKSMPFTAYEKIRNTPAGTAALVATLGSHLVWETSWARSAAVSSPDRMLPIVRGDRFSSVRKTRLTERGVKPQPTLNGYAQLGIGKHLRRRLLRFGIDLSEGQALHRNLARSASITESHITIDLSNASDTICINLVKLLLPEVWYELLSICRVPLTRDLVKKKKWLLLEQFSAMGNGYTFELETLVFCSILHAVGCRIGIDTWVYGDDMIVPKDKEKDVLAALQACGFTPNMRKTFTSGHFRESCGGDYMNGFDVRAIYLTSEPSCPAEWISLANQVRSLATRFGIPELLHGTWHSILDCIPSGIRSLRGPVELGDLVIHDHLAKWKLRFEDGIRYIRTYNPVPARWLLTRGCKAVRAGGYILDRVPKFGFNGQDGDVALTAFFLGLPSTGLSIRNRIEGYRIRWTPFS